MLIEDSLKILSQTKCDRPIRSIVMINIHLKESPPHDSKVLQLILLHERLLYFDNIHSPLSHKQQIIYIQDKMDQTIIPLGNKIP